VDAHLVKQKDWGERMWFINGEGQAFAVIEGPVEFRMGSPPTETERTPERTSRRSISPLLRHRHHGVTRTSSNDF